MTAIDKSKVSAAFDRAASTYDARANFQHQICDRLASLLPPTSPERILDGGCGTGYGAELLRQRWPSAQLIGCDLAPEMVRLTQQRGIPAVCGDLEHLPFADDSFDLVWSSLALQWCQLSTAFSELQRVLTPGGTLVCTTLGGGTLFELETAFSGIDQHRRILPFITRQTLETALAAAGFSRIQIIHETWVTRHPDFKDLLTSIRGIGASQSGHDQRRSLMGKTAWQAVQARYEAMRGEDGMLPVTYEVMFVLADK